MIQPKTRRWHEDLQTQNRWRRVLTPLPLETLLLHARALYLRSSIASEALGEEAEAIAAQIAARLAEQTAQLTKM